MPRILLFVSLIVWPTYAVETVIPFENLWVSNLVNSEFKAKVVQRTEVVDGENRSTYHILYTLGNPPEQKEVPISQDDLDELKAIEAQMMTPDLHNYGVKRKSNGYAYGRPERMVVGLDLFGLRRYTDSENDRLAEAYKDKNPLFVRVNFQLTDADREKNLDGKTVSTGRIVLQDDGTIGYVDYSKMVSVYGGVDGKPLLIEDVPTPREALDEAKEGDASRLRFAADFGPQGHPEGRQLMPVAPIDIINKDGERWVVFLPVDQIQAYRRGEIPKRRLFTIPAHVLRYVEDGARFTEIVDDYLDIRRTKDTKDIFVANRDGMELTVGTVMRDGQLESEIVNPKDLARSIDSLQPVDAGRGRLNKPGQSATEILDPKLLAESERGMGSEPKTEPVKLSPLKRFANWCRRKFGGGE